jgi:hypothetical protein
MTDQLLFPDPSNARLNELRDLAFASPSLTEMARVVLAVIAHQRGASMAMRIEDIIAAGHRLTSTILTERQVKAACKELIEEHDIPVVGSRVEPMGYYLALTPEEIQAAVRPLKAQICSEQRRVSALEKYYQVLAGQMSMEARHA